MANLLSLRSLPSAMDKAQIRTVALAQRKTAAARFPHAGQFLATQTEQISALIDRQLGAQFTRPPLVAGYWPKGSEINPEPLLCQLADHGMSLCLPVVTDRASCVMRFYRWRPESQLHPDLLGIPAPKPEGSALEPQVLLLPLLSFDRFGTRLGYGRGFYDRYLAATVSCKRRLLIGLAYSDQAVERLPGRLSVLPREAHDQPLDAVLSEKGLLLIDSM